MTTRRIRSIGIDLGTTTSQVDVYKRQFSLSSSDVDAIDTVRHHLLASEPNVAEKT